MLGYRLRGETPTYEEGPKQYSFPDHIKLKGRITLQYNPKKFIQSSSSGKTYKLSFFARKILIDSVIESETYDGSNGAISNLIIIGYNNYLIVFIFTYIYFNIFIIYL